MENEVSKSKSIVRNRWFWVGVIVVLGGVFAYAWISGHNATERDEQEKARIEKETSQDTQNQEPVIIRPTSTPVLSLPFTPQDKPNGLIPMGETIFHADAVDGHPGIDFQWNTNKEIKIIASMDASIVDIRGTESNGTTMIVTKTSDGWGIDYCGLEAANPNLKIGDSIKVGDFIGWPNDEGIQKKGVHYKSTHWQFGYYDVTQRDIHQAGTEPRLCPMIYFDNASKILIEEIWANTDSPKMKANAPEICSGGYKGKNR